MTKEKDKKRLNQAETAENAIRNLLYLAEEIVIECDNTNLSYYMDYT